TPAPYADWGADAASSDPAAHADPFAAAAAADAERASGAGQAAPVGSAALADLAPHADRDADHASPVAHGTTAPGAHAEPVADAGHGAPVEPFLPADPFVEAAERAVRAAEGERDAHERTADGEPQDIEEETFSMRLPEQPADDVTSDRVTDKGLPKRTPKIVAPSTAPAGRTGSVDAEALRRRLGGFHRGAQEGRRDAEAEIAQSGTQQATRATDEQNTDTETGDTVEEARS
ncbi:histidine kinase, partial [Streptomyces sp. NPDC002867]